MKSPPFFVGLASLVRPTFIAAFLLLGFSAAAQAQWDCTTYGQFAIRDVNAAAAAGCGFGGPRWSGDEGFHYGYCIDRTNAGDDAALTRETDLRQEQLSQCQIAKGQQADCTSYAQTAMSQVNEAKTLGCGFEPPQWSDDEGLHYGYCVDRTNAGDRAALASETSARATALAECKARVAAVPPKPPKIPKEGTVAVKLPVELYDAPDNGNHIGDVPAGTRVLVFECADNNMCKIDGGPEYQGWVYDAADYDTLDRPKG